MPNWGINHTTVTGPADDVDEFYSAITNDDGSITMVVNITPDTDGYGDSLTEIEDSGTEKVLRYEVPWGPLMDSTWEEISLRFPTLTFDTSYDEWDNLVMGRIVAHNGRILAHVTIDPDEWPEEPEMPDDEEDEEEYERWNVAQQSYMDAVGSLDIKIDERLAEALNATQE